VQDLSIVITTGDYSFCWKGLSVGLRTAADLISAHLITPLLAFGWASLDLKEGMKQITGDALEKVCRFAAPSMVLISLIIPNSTCDQDLFNIAKHLTRYRRQRFGSQSSRALSRSSARRFTPDKNCVGITFLRHITVY